jgi:hypothetical protein
MDAAKLAGFTDLKVSGFFSLPIFCCCQFSDCCMNSVQKPAKELLM